MMRNTVVDCAPITLRTDLLEGSQVAEQDPKRLRSARVTIPPNELRDRQAAGTGVTVGDRR